MKKSDIAMIILIASISVLIAYFVAKAVIGGDKAQTATVKTIDPISSEVAAPDPDVFNNNAINPTVEALIGNVGASQSGS